MGLLESEAVVELLETGVRRHATVANNLANLNTPGYRSGRLEFARELDEVLDARGRLKDGQRVESRRMRPGYRAPGENDVELAREVGIMKRNSVKMRLYMAVLSSRIQRLRTAIEGK